MLCALPKCKVINFLTSCADQNPERQVTFSANCRNARNHRVAASDVDFGLRLGRQLMVISHRYRSSEIVDLDSGTLLELGTRLDADESSATADMVTATSRMTTYRRPSLRRVRPSKTNPQMMARLKTAISNSKPRSSSHPCLIQDLHRVTILMGNSNHKTHPSTSTM